MYNISVIIPFYNSHETIGAAVQSIFDQTYLNETFTFDILIIDDGSQIALQNVFSSPAGVNISIYRQDNHGAADARNFGLKNIRNSNFVAFLDADDIWEPSKTIKMIDIILKHQFAMLGSFSNSHSFFKTASGAPVTIGINHQIFKNYFLTSSVIINLGQVDRKIIYFPKHQTHAEEGDLFLRLVKRYKCGVIPLNFVDYSNAKGAFGISGLSGNLIEMQKGEIKNLNACFRRRDISFGIFSLALLFSLLKFLRRLIINKN